MEKVKKIIVHTPRDKAPWVHCSIVEPIPSGVSYRCNLPKFQCFDLPSSFDISDLDGIAKWVGEQVKGIGWEVSKEVDVVLCGLIGRRWYGNGISERLYEVLKKGVRQRNVNSR